MVTWTEQGIEYEADQIHAELIIRSLGLEDSKQISTPGEKDERTGGEEAEGDKRPSGNWGAEADDRRSSRG